MNSTPDKPTIRTRIAPSPTGIAHIGTAYYAIYNYAIAKQNGGQFIVRIEDTDRTRFVEGAEQVIYDAMKWLAIPYDEGPDIGGPYAPYKQSERLPLYKKYAEELIANNHAYYCFCTPQRLETMRNEQQAHKQVPKYDRLCRSISKADAQKRVAAGEKHVIRMMIPDDETIAWDDLVRGHVEFQSNDVDDQVILKSDSFPTYHLAVVIDDHEMKITHVLRGEDWISSTPKHILLYRYFGWELPIIAHMPLLRNSDKSKMSKRKNDVSIMSYKDKGYLPQALRNYLSLMGWSHPEGKEIFSMEEYVKVFSLERMRTTGPVFDVNKLNWMNGMYIRELARPELKKQLAPFLPKDFPKDIFDQLLDLVAERLVTLADIEELTAFFYRPIFVAKADLIKKSTEEEVKTQLEKISATLEAISDWTVPVLEEKIRQIQADHDYKKSQYFMMLRLAVTGQSATPPLFETMTVLGREKSLERVNAALALLSRA